MRKNPDDAWHVRLPRRLRAAVERLAIEEDRHPVAQHAERAERPTHS
jgi:hypothetical protein